MKVSRYFTHQLSDSTAWCVYDRTIRHPGNETGFACVNWGLGREDAEAECARLNASPARADQFHYPRNAYFGE